MIITISGKIGAGKTTLAKRIAQRFKLDYISAGKMMREMAEEHDMSLMEFSKFAELNSWIDKEVDGKQKELAKESGNCVVESRLSAHFIDADVKVFLIGPLEVRAKRIMERDSLENIEEAKKLIQKREESERKRYKKIYHINLENLEVYDFILNTGNFKPEEMDDIVSSVIETKVAKT